jgi:hypothetical protein
MKTLFLPLAPNPVMGGHLVHLPEDRVIDVEMTVEEGIRTVVTSGVAISDADGDGRSGLSEEQLRGLGGVQHADQQMDPSGADPYDHRRDDAATDRAARYDRQVAPEHADTPEHLERREGPDDRETYGPDGRPATRSRTADERASTDGTPAEMAGRSRGESEPTDEPPADVTPESRPDGDDAGSTPGDGRPADRRADRKREGDGDTDHTP